MALVDSAFEGSHGVEKSAGVQGEPGQWTSCAEGDQPYTSDRAFARVYNPDSRDDNDMTLSLTEYTRVPTRRTL